MAGRSVLTAPIFSETALSHLTLRTTGILLAAVILIAMLVDWPETLFRVVLDTFVDMFYFASPDKVLRHPDNHKYRNKNSKVEQEANE